MGEDGQHGRTIGTTTAERGFRGPNLVKKSEHLGQPILPNKNERLNWRLTS